jgi:uncharacterized protein (DUF1778 family)
MVSEAQKRAKKVYDKKTKELFLRLRLNQDRDVIQRLDEVPNKTEFIRELIRRDIRENTNEQ